MATIQQDGLCPECETGRLKEIKKDLSFTYKGRSMQFSQMSVLACSVCGHERLSEKASARVDRELTDFSKSIDGLLYSHELRQIRLKLKLKIKDMARLKYGWESCFMTKNMVLDSPENPNHFSKWAMRDSNARPLVPETNALST